jgi:hypothetical protein
MRRAALAVVICGLALGGSTVPASAGEIGTQTVSYEGYEITVPASWPVYWLAHDPQQCVRYDVHAVYLGTPGPNQQCPPRLVGRTDTVSIASPMNFQLAAASAASAQPGMTGGSVVRLVPGLDASIVEDNSAHQLRVALRDTGNTVATATYGNSSGAMSQVLATLRKSPPVASPVASVSRVVAAARVAARPARAMQQAGPVVRVAGERDTIKLPDGMVVVRVQPTTISLPDGAPPARPSSAPTPVRTVARVKPARPNATAPALLSGFDTCTAPSLAAMRAWRSKYAVAGIYIGGANMACDYGNLSASWVRSVTGMGWGLLPVYVGLQAPCYGYGDMISARYAAAQGAGAAEAAAKDAATFGLPAGSPVYYDMEAYNEANRSCVSTVLKFLGAWTETLNQHHYLSGVYSSEDSGVQDLQTAAVAGKIIEPQAIWFALWDNERNLIGGPVLGPRPWLIGDRVKQYAGGHNQKVGGITLNIDSDLVGGPVAR